MLLGFVGRPTGRHKAPQAVSFFSVVRLQGSRVVFLCFYLFCGLLHLSFHHCHFKSNRAVLGIGLVVLRACRLCKQAQLTVGRRVSSPTMVRKVSTHSWAHTFNSQWCAQFLLTRLPFCVPMLLLVWWPSPALVSPLPFQIKPRCSWYWLGGA